MEKYLSFRYSALFSSEITAQIAVKIATGYRQNLTLVPIVLR